MVDIVRKRGRPKGASRYNNADETRLITAARHLVRGKAKTPTAAFRLAGAKDDSEIRRLRNKWNENSDHFLSEADRLEREVSGTFIDPNKLTDIIAQNRLSLLAADAEDLRKCAQNTLGVFNDLQKTSISRMLKELQNAPGMRFARAAKELRKQFRPIVGYQPDLGPLLTRRR